jgi:aspartate/methionine/tyrosine aminotransferase
MPRFSERTQWDLTQNRLSLLRAQLSKQGKTILDLTVSNPTAAGLSYPPEWVDELADPALLSYAPDPKGNSLTRRSIAALFSKKGVPVTEDKIILTASTSEAYAWLFRLLADPGDRILVPSPSYPLFGYLAGLNDLETAPYFLRGTGDGPWRLDPESVVAAFNEKTRAIIAVHPNNPTGSALRADEARWLADFCAQRGVALISDEVFAEYLHAPGAEIPPTLLGNSGPLTFALGGLSKFAGLPQMKLGWIACDGPAADCAQAMARLEIIADTYLSVNAPVQRAAAAWIVQAERVQQPIRSRLAENLKFLREQTKKGPWQLLPSDGGWSAVLHNPMVTDEEKWLASLLEKKSVWVHPGFFFDFEQGGFIVVSLLCDPQQFREGIKRICSDA